MGLKLYGSLISPPVRAVLMCAKAINLELDLVRVDLIKRDNLKLEFMKMNPLHTIPVLDDDGFILVDSHAIMGYLVENYAKDKSLYDTDVKKRARINQMLHFDSGTFFARYIRNSLPVILDGVKLLPEENNKAIAEAYGYVEMFLQNNKFIAGSDLTIADFSVITTLTNSRAFVPLEDDKYPRIKSWEKTLQTLSYYEINRIGGEEYHNLVNSVLLK